MLFLFIGIIFLKSLFGNIYLLPLLVITHQQYSPIKITWHFIPVIFSIIYYGYHDTTSELNLYYIVITILIIIFTLYYSYIDKDNPIYFNQKIKKYTNKLIISIIFSSVQTLWTIITNRKIKTQTKTVEYKNLNTNMTTALAASITSTPGTFAISAKTGYIIINSIGEFEDELYKMDFFQKDINNGK